jgi:hypothetical protein
MDGEGQLIGSEKLDSAMVNEYELDANFPDNVKFVIGNAVSEKFIGDLDLVLDFPDRVDRFDNRVS